LSAGIHYLPVNFKLNPGHQYQLSASGIINLYRNTSGVTYPYEVSDLIKITGNSQNQSGRYYYFYNWIVSEICTSPRSEIVIDVELPSSPIGVGDVICKNDTAILSATSSNNIRWYNQPIGGISLGTGNSFTTQPLDSSTVFYAETFISGTLGNVGAINNNIGSGQNYGSGNRYLIFDVIKPCTLKTVTVYAQGNAFRTIELRDSTGIVLDSISVNIPNGQQVVNLNFLMNPGVSYQLGVSGTVNLYRNSSGAVYPYTLNGILNITGFNSGSSGSYYFFYDWEVKEASCASSRTPVLVEVDTVTAGFSYVSNNLNVDFTDLSQNATAWNWDFGDGNFSNLPNPTNNYLNPGTYIVTLVAISPLNNCPDTITQSITLTTVGIKTLYEEENVRIFPNPVYNDVTISGLSNSTYSIKVKDSYGRVVISFQKVVIDNKIKFNLVENLSKGIYFIEMFSKNKLTRRKISVQ